MSFFPGNDPNPRDIAAIDAIELMAVPNSKDIGGFEVRRALPSAQRQMVGPFIFFDQMGPAEFLTGSGIDVRPHPHIGLGTVTYLFDGQIRHRDSLGTEMVIVPGDVNLMTAGRGIVHSERTPEEMRASAMGMHGLQTWLALPERLEETDPAFAHTTAADLPELEGEGAHARVVMGSFYGATSPVRQYHDTLYVDLRLEAGAAVTIPADAEERALYTLEGEITVSGDTFPPDRLLVLRPGDVIDVRSAGGARFMLFGGASMGSRRYIWWNFVSSSRERIEQAKEEWKTGRFDIVPGDEEEFIPLPEA